MVDEQCSFIQCLGRPSCAYRCTLWSSCSACLCSCPYISCQGPAAIQWIQVLSEASAWEKHFGEKGRTWEDSQIRYFLICRLVEVLDRKEEMPPLHLEVGEPFWCMGVPGLAEHGIVSICPFLLSRIFVWTAASAALSLCLALHGAHNTMAWKDPSPRQRVFTLRFHSGRRAGRRGLFPLATFCLFHARFLSLLSWQSSQLNWSPFILFICSSPH